VIGIGAWVYLKACRGAGEPGTVIREERGKWVVHWADLNLSSRHREESLEIAVLFHSQQGEYDHGNNDRRTNPREAA